MTHGTTTTIVEPLPGRTTFDPVPWLVLSYDVPDDMVGPREVRASAHSKASGASGSKGTKNKTGNVFLLVANSKVVLKCSSAGNALSSVNYRARGDFYKDFMRLGVHVFNNGDLIWMESHKTPLRAEGLEVVDVTKKKGGADD